MTRTFLKRSCKAVVHTLAVLSSLATSSASPSMQQTEISVSDGWHPWYEIKADPENPRDFIICGTKWDARLNTPFGFIYNSTDGGLTWRTALEDRSSVWVTEHSCAFGLGHTAYFISEAAKVVDGVMHHELGTSRLYISADGGVHWAETLETGWADYSTSAVSYSTGNLYTFFNANTNDPSRKWGANVGLLLFSHNGKNVAGPFLNTEIQDVGYEGIYPSDATVLKSGRVVALYWGTRQMETGREADLGVIRADPSPEPVLGYARISHIALSNDCLNFDSGSLAYDPRLNRLYVVYVDGCKETRIMIASSDDEGKTWSKSVPVGNILGPSRTVINPSLAATATGALGLLWEEGQGSGRWLFSYIRNTELVQPPIELSFGSAAGEVSNDALWTWIYQAEASRAGELDGSPESSITVNVRTELNNVWRGRGLVASGDRLFAIWPSGNQNGVQLHSRVLQPPGAISLHEKGIDSKDAVETDVTSQTAMLYGGTQEFDTATESLKVCLVLANWGDKAIKIPIKLQVKDIASPMGSVSILDSANGVLGTGAIWDISGAVTGNQIPPQMKSNPFCLSFHIGAPSEAVRRLKGDDLLTIKIKIYAATSSSSLPEQPKD